MKQTPNVDTFQQRKDTFLRRGRFRWPYIKYASYLAQPSTLASAGFAFSPVKDAPDNVQCFHCGFELTGWEPSDDPFAEHYAHQPNCTYAKLHCQVRVAHEGDKVEWIGWPIDSAATPEADEWKRLVEMRQDAQNMRLATFKTMGGGWPHAGRVDWNVTPEKLSKAGFYYTPEWPGDDTATCAFCGYALAEWEPEDEPNTEHARRAPDCLFFKLDMAQCPTPQHKALLQVQSPQACQPRRISIRASRESEAAAAATANYKDDVENESDSSSASKRPRLGVDSLGLSEEEQETQAVVEEVKKTTNGNERQQFSDIGEDVLETSPGPSETKQRSPQPNVSATEVTAALPALYPTEMHIDDVSPSILINSATTVDDTQATTQVDSTVSEELDVDAWELTEDEERMTVEEFIRACCDHKIASLEASAAHMVGAFMQRAESTRDRIYNMSW
ncbi:hypothetical protein EV174_005374 [Coemansia sp. RSA 2320]|nr:hypothetical protein EV174_005374 [Coemansia sp. RSA 2320]